VDCRKSENREQSELAACAVVNCILPTFSQLMRAGARELQIPERVSLNCLVGLLSLAAMSPHKAGELRNA
jgi:hypothetical protein